MSLLGTQVYANSSTPCWLSSGGGTASGTVVAPQFATTPGGDILLRDVSGNSGMRIVATTTGVNYLQNSGVLNFGQIGQGTVNTALTTSAPGANADVLRVGGTVDTNALKLPSVGAAACVGTSTLTAGQVVVATTASDVNSYILITRGAVNASTTLGELRVSNKGANNFTVVSVNPATPSSTQTGDLSSFDWVIINPA